MVTRIGHIALRVRDLDAAVDFQRRVIGMVEVERSGGAAYPGRPAWAAREGYRVAASASTMP